MKQILEILIPLGLIIVLLFCMMNNTTEEAFSIGGQNHRDSNIYNIHLPKTWSEYSQKILKKKFRTQNIRSKKLLKNLGNITSSLDLRNN